MATINRQQSTHQTRDEVFTPTRTLAQSDSAVLVGTLVWAKHSHWPWWPGLVVSTNDVGWPPYLKKKHTHCILWLGPNKNASVIPVHKISDFLDPNLIRLMNQPIKEGQEQEKATLEALRGLLSLRILDENELHNIPVRKLKSLAVQTRIESEFIHGRKPVVLDKTSCWFKRTIESLKSSNETLKLVSNKKRTTRLPLAINLQKRTIIIPANSHQEGSSSSSASTRSAEMSPSAADYCKILAKKTGEEGDEPPPRKKISLAKQATDQGAFNTGVGEMPLLRKLLQDKLFRSVELPKFVEKEKMRASNGDLYLATNQTADEQKARVEGHKAVLQTVPAFSAPVLHQSELQPDGTIDCQKPAGAGKRLVSETDIPILIQYLDGSHSMESTVNGFIGHLERTRPQEKVPSKVQVKDKVREMGTWNKKTSTWMVLREVTKPIIPDISIEKNVHPDGAPSQPANTETPSIRREFVRPIQPQLKEFQSPLKLTLPSLNYSPLSSLPDCKISDSSVKNSDEGEEKGNVASGSLNVIINEGVKMMVQEKKLYLSPDAQMDLVKQVLTERISECNVSSEKKKKRTRKSKASRKNWGKAKELPGKKENRFKYVTLDAQIDLVAKVLAEKVRETKADVLAKKMKK